jgi:hypothetical protein
MTDERYSRVPTRAAGDSDLSRTALRVLVAIGRYVNRHGRAIPALATLATMTGLDRRNLPAAIRELEERGYLSRVRRRDEKGDYTSTEYAIDFGPGGDMPPHATGDMPGHDTVTCQDTPPGDMPPHALSIPLSEETHLRRSTEPEGFDKFYASYPRHIAKGAARKAYKSALKKADAATLLAAAERFAAANAGTDQKFIPYPATWLNSERWADAEPEAGGVTAQERDDNLQAARLQALRERGVWLPQWGKRPSQGSAL